MTTPKQRSVKVSYEKITVIVAKQYYVDDEKNRVSAVDSVLGAIQGSQHGFSLVDCDAEFFELTPNSSVVKQESGDA